MREPSFEEMNSLPERTPSSNIRLLRHLMPLLLRHKFRLFLSICAVFLASGSSLGIGFGMRQIIDSAFSDSNTAPPMSGLLFLFGCIIMMAIASFGRTYYVTWLGERLVTDLRRAVFRHLLTLEVGFFDSIRSGEIVSRLTTDISLIQILAGTSVAVALRNFILFVGGVVMMIIISPHLSLLTSAIIPLILVPLILYGKAVKRQSRKSQDSLAYVSGYLEETLSSIRTCYAFNREQEEIRRFSQLGEENFRISAHRLLLKSSLTFLVMILVFGAIAGLCKVGAQSVITGEISAGDLISFLFYAIIAASSASSFSDIYMDLQRAAGAMERLFDILGTPSKNKFPSKGRLLPEPTRGVIGFHNVSFSYPLNPTHPILNNVTFSVAPGENLAIVGPSGVGKTTIFSLLLRFFDPQSGSIYVDGIDIKDVPLDDLRARFGIVSQDPMIFSGSLYDNILYGRSTASEMDVWRAAEAAHLGEFIRSLPKGMNTLLGPRGVRLSGGQKQRLSIARVLLRNAPILLLDEATSALDAHSELLVQESLKDLMATRTTLVIAHRLSTVLKADRIVVLKDGLVDAIGTHAELISEDGLYRQLATLQFTDSPKEHRNKRRQTHSQWG